MVIPLYVGRPRSGAAIEMAAANEHRVFLVSQKHSEEENPTREGVYDYGTIGKVLQTLKLPDGSLKVLVEGICRAKLNSYVDNGEVISSEVIEVSDDFSNMKEGADVLVKALDSQFSEYSRYNENITQDITRSLKGITEPERYADLVAAHLPLSVESKQSILEASDVVERVDKIFEFLQREIEWMQVEKRIQTRVRERINEDQKRYFKREKIKAMQAELGESELEVINEEYYRLEKKIKDLGLPSNVFEKVETELNKLKLMPMMSAEATVIRNYLEWIIDIPWHARSEVCHDLAAAAKSLDADHYGLKEVKDRIIEYLAVFLKVKKLKSPIICLVGPPGVGKTSLGQSIAKATGREFCRVSLGGVHDEAEIRGHRKTYIGAMPGRMIKALRKAEVVNPLLLLDEVDKMGMDFRGDPASALLEVLDPEQNNTFNDHYLEVDYDLSDVLFITTANSMDIPPPLMDRMEIIRIAGYTEVEKLHIAKRHLIPKTLEAHGILPSEMRISDPAILKLIRNYTREAGVRELERGLAKIARRFVKNTMLKPGYDSKKKQVIGVSALKKYLGVHRYDFSTAGKQDVIGKVKGMAWTEVGGDLLDIEALIYDGKGELNYTGSLGDVMGESIEAALSLVKARMDKLSIPKDFFSKKDIHIHVPEGATPKDGPSAGVAICTAIVSVCTNKVISHQIAMTGEITILGHVLPIGGLKEKLLAANRGGIKRVLIPKDNEKDLEEIPKDVIGNLDIVSVKSIDDVLRNSLIEES
ncbi:MAG: endopeptidase La [Legionellales bacterium]|nr:endopeptidase La [Legionellales bacterium]